MVRCSLSGPCFVKEFSRITNKYHCQVWLIIHCKLIQIYILKKSVKEMTDSKWYLILIHVLAKFQITTKLYLNNGEMTTSSIFLESPHAFMCFGRLLTCHRATKHKHFNMRFKAQKFAKERTSQLGRDRSMLQDCYWLVDFFDEESTNGNTMAEYIYQYLWNIHHDICDHFEEEFHVNPSRNTWQHDIQVNLTSNYLVERG